MSTIVKKKIEVGALSWISERPHPLTMHGLRKITLNPGWVFDTHVGLVATSNPQPPAAVNFRSFQQSKQFRSLMFCSFEIEVDKASDKVISFKVIDSFHDAGWTPPFTVSKVKATWVPSWWDKDIMDRNYYAGELGQGAILQTRQFHDNSMMRGAVKADQVLVNSVIKFRAGRHTDDLGIKKVKSPFHVPWVWCEMLLTYNKGKLQFFGVGSEFPTHTWYLNGKSVAQVDRVGDSSFPIASSGLLTSEIDVKKMKIYPVLAAGMPAASPQLPVSKTMGPVSGHLYTAKAGNKIVRTIAL